MQIDTLIKAGWIIPVEPDHRVLENHAVAICDGRIAAICSRTEADEQMQARQVCELPQHALIPGLINAHTHAPMTLFRGLADDLPLSEWLEQHIWPAEQRWASAEFVRDGSFHAIAEMLAGGTTCFADMYFYPDQVARVAADTGIRAVIGMIVIDFPSAWAQSTTDYFLKGEAVHDRYRDHALVRTMFAPHAPYSVSESALLRVRTLADQLDVPVTMHVHESAGEIARAIQEHGERPLSQLQRLGLLSPRLLAVHMTQLLDAEVESLARFAVNVVHCPESNLKLANGFCPVEKLRRAGINVALGTDGAASNNDLDMFGEMRTAALLAKAVAGNSNAVTAAEALDMATINGARALGIDQITGSIREGKAADLVAVNLGGLNTQPLYDPLSQIVYVAGRANVAAVWVNGRQLVGDGELLELDSSQIIARSALWQRRIATADHADTTSHGGTGVDSADPGIPAIDDLAE